MECSEFYWESQKKHIESIVRENHLYFPTWWITETKSDFTGICDRLEKRAYEVLQTELAKRKKS
jgi:hypothetical protein